MRKISTFEIFFILSWPANRDVDIGAQVPVLHIPVTGAQIAQDLTQFYDIGGGFFWAANIGAADDFHQRHSGTIQINK